MKPKITAQQPQTKRAAAATTAWQAAIATSAAVAVHQWIDVHHIDLPGVIDVEHLVSGAVALGLGYGASLARSFIREHRQLVAVGTRTLVSLGVGTDTDRDGVLDQVENIVGDFDDEPDELRHHDGRGESPTA